MTPYRHTLNRRQPGQCHRQNPNMAPSRQGQILERIIDDAIRLGHGEWRVIDVNNGRQIMFFLTQRL